MQVGALSPHRQTFANKFSGKGALKFSFDMSVPNVATYDPQRGGCCTVAQRLACETARPCHCRPRRAVPHENGRGNDTR